MARKFDATATGLITMQNTTGMSGYRYGTVAACVMVPAHQNTGADPVFCLGTTSTADTVDAINVYYANSNAYGMWDGTSDSIGPTATTLDRWHVIAITKDTGTVAPRVHTYPFTTATWTHGNASPTIADTTTDATWVLIPGVTGFTNSAAIAAIAIWDKRALTDGECERLPSGLWQRWSPDTLIEYPSGRDFPAETHADIGRSRIPQTTVGSTVASYSQAGPPGFRFSPMSRRR